MSEFDGMTADQLRAALADFARGSQPAPPVQPDAPGCSELTPKSREAARDLFGAAIMRKEAGAVTKTERDFLAASIAATLREMAGQ